MQNDLPQQKDSEKEPGRFQFSLGAIFFWVTWCAIFTATLGFQSHETAKGASIVFAYAFLGITAIVHSVRSLRPQINETPFDEPPSNR